MVIKSIFRIIIIITIFIDEILGNWFLNILFGTCSGRRGGKPSKTCNNDGGTQLNSWLHAETKEAFQQEALSCCSVGAASNKGRFHWFGNTWLNFSSNQFTVSPQQAHVCIITTIVPVQIGSASPSCWPNLPLRLHFQVKILHSLPFNSNTQIYFPCVVAW